MASQAALFAAMGYDVAPLWAAVDDYTGEHLNQNQNLDGILHDSIEAGLPPIATYPILAKMLAMHCYTTDVTNVLELGTLGAYTPIWLCTFNPKLKVTTIEFNPHHAEVAAANCLKYLGESWKERVEILVGARRDVLPGLLQQVEQGKRARFGLTYIDADKGNNWFYFDHALKMSYPKASVYVDNVVRQGSLITGTLPEYESADFKKKVYEDWERNPKLLPTTNQSIEGSREVVEKAGKDPRVEAIVLQTVSGKSWDGHLWAILK